MIFQEKQRFDQWWLWVLLLGIEGFFIYGIVQDVYFGHPFGNKPGGLVGGIIVNFLIIIPLILGFFLARLETRIDKIGICFRWKVFGGEFNSIMWSQIKDAFLIEYKNTGSGIRISPQNGTIYNTSGNKGLQIILNSGEKYLIGTHKPEELQKVLQEIKAGAETE